MFGRSDPMSGGCVCWHLATPHGARPMATRRMLSCATWAVWVRFKLALGLKNFWNDEITVAPLRHGH